ncbi:hypothetical protein ACE6H2_000640 [Prunus campanulata]
MSPSTGGKEKKKGGKRKLHDGSDKKEKSRKGSKEWDFFSVDDSKESDENEEATENEEASMSPSAKGKDKKSGKRKLLVQSLVLMDYNAPVARRTQLSEEKY